MDELLNDHFVYSVLGTGGSSYNPEIDIAEITSRYQEGSSEFLNMELFLQNEKHESNRVVIKDCMETLDAIEEHFCANNVFKAKLKYFHLYGNQEYTQFFTNLIGSDECFEQLRELLVTSKFGDYAFFKDLYTGNMKKMAGCLPK